MRVPETDPHAPDGGGGDPGFGPHALHAPWGGVLGPTPMPCPKLEGDWQVNYFWSRKFCFAFYSTFWSRKLFFDSYSTLQMANETITINGNDIASVVIIERWVDAFPCAKEDEPTYPYDIHDGWD